MLTPGRSKCRAQLVHIYIHVIIQTIHFGQKLGQNRCLATQEIQLLNLSNASVWKWLEMRKLGGCESTWEFWRRVFTAKLLPKTEIFLGNREQTWTFLGWDWREAADVFGSWRPQNKIITFLLNIILIMHTLLLLFMWMCYCSEQVCSSMKFKNHTLKYLVSPGSITKSQICLQWQKMSQVSIRSCPWCVS